MRVACFVTLEVWKFSQIISECLSHTSLQVLFAYEGSWHTKDIFPQVRSYFS